MKVQEFKNELMSGKKMWVAGVDFDGIFSEEYSANKVNGVWYVGWTGLKQPYDETFEDADFTEDEGYGYTEREAIVDYLNKNADE